MNLIEMSGVTKSIRSTFILDNFSLSFERGVIYGLIGLNGAGKTTLMRVIAGLVLPSSGSVSYMGDESADALRKLRRNSGFFIESPVLYPDIAAYENLTNACILRGIDFDCIPRALDAMSFDPTPDSDDMHSLRRSARRLSAGMRQRVALSEALLGEPEFLVLDEPSNGLDTLSVKKFYRYLTEINSKNGTTILISSHRLDELRSMCDVFIFMHKGRVMRIMDSGEMRDEMERREIDVEQLFEQIIGVDGAVSHD